MIPKYYDYKRSRPVDLDNDGCPLKDWNQKNNEKSFCIHPDGFLIFLDPNEIVVSDEYSKFDPYNVDGNLDEQFQKNRIEATVALLQKAINDNKLIQPKVLDVGCGEGHLTDQYMKHIPSVEASGLDYSVSAVSKASKMYTGIDFIAASAYECPYSENYFDIVVCNNLWEHVPDPLLLLASIRRVLKAGGFLVISTPSRYRMRNLIRVCMGCHVEFMSHHHVTEYTVGQVKEQLSYGGFKLETISGDRLVSNRLFNRIVKFILSSWLRFVGSHHRLDATVFYLALKVD